MNSSKKNLLVTAPLDFLPDIKKMLNSEFNLHYHYSINYERTHQVLSTISFDGWLVSPCPEYKIDSKLMDLCPTLSIIATPSTGSNHINTQDAKNRNIYIYSLKGSEEVNKIYASSEYTFHLMMATIRYSPFAFQSVLNGNWREVEDLFRGREMDGLTLGIIGYGRIGSNLAKYANTFRMNVLAYDPYVEIPQSDGVQQFLKLEDFLPKCDVLAVCIHLNDETYRIINESFFQQLKDGVYFINTSRGDVVDEDALIENLQNGKIKAAGIDVISNEFSSDKSRHPLIQHAKRNNNLIITPHIAGLTYDSERKAQQAAVDAIRHHLKSS